MAAENENDPYAGKEKREQGLIEAPGSEERQDRHGGPLHDLCSLSPAGAASWQRLNAKACASGDSG